MAKGVIWQGQDGQGYIKDANGVRATGNFQGSLPTNKLLELMAQGYEIIEDPNPGNPGATKDPSPTDPGNTVVGGGGSQFTDTSAARNATMQNLNSLDRQLANMNRTAQNDYDALMTQYGAENEANLKNYQGQVAKNENTRSGGISQSLASAAQGGRGLRAALSAMGALGGTGSLLANRAVASTANRDIGGVNETFETNAGNLNTAWEKTEREQRQREEDARTSLRNARTKNAGSIAQQRQQGYKDMAGFWEQAGNNSEAANWLSKMGGQNKYIEAASLAATPSFQRASADFSPAAFKNYLAGNQNMEVQTQPLAGGPAMNSPIYASRERREEYA